MQYEYRSWSLNVYKESAKDTCNWKLIFLVKFIIGFDIIHGDLQTLISIEKDNGKIICPKRRFVHLSRV